MDIELIKDELVKNLSSVKEYVDGRIDGLAAKAGRPADGLTETPETFSVDTKGILSPKQKVFNTCPSDLPDGLKAENISIGRILRGMALGDWKGADAERAVVTRKSLGSSNDTAGGFLLPDSVSSSVIDLARAASTFVRAGGYTMPLEDGRYALPTLTSDPTGDWKGENAQGTFSDMAFGRINITPRTLVVLLKSSVELLEDSPGALDSFINSVFAATIGKEIDRVAYLGNGTSEPMGVWNATGLNSVAGGGALTGYGKFLDAAQKIYEANYQGDYGGLSIVMPPRTMTALEKLIDTTNQPLVSPDAYSKMKKFQTTQASKTLGAGSNESMVLTGDFSQAVLAVRKNLTFEATRAAGDAFRDLQVWFRAYIRVDVVTIRPTFFTKMTGVTN